MDYTLHPNPTDTRTLATHIEQYKSDYNTAPEVITADAGYGSLENYTYLAAQHIEQYVKYNYFDKDQSDNYQSKHPFTADKLYYNKEKNYYICPMGQQMHHLGSYSKVLNSGFVQLISRYQAQNCSHCPLKGTCHKAKGNRIIEVNHNFNQLKKEVRAQLTSEKGIYHRKRRPVMIEPIFANIKHNHGFRRFMLSGKDKVEVETGLLALAHNLRKKCA